MLTHHLQPATVARAGCRASGESAATTWCTARLRAIAAVQLSERVRQGTLWTSCSITSPLSRYTADENLWLRTCCVPRNRSKCWRFLRHSMSAWSHVCEPAVSTSYSLCVVFRWEDANRNRLGSARPNVDGLSVGDGRVLARCVPGRQAGGVGHELATIYTKVIPPLGTCS